MNLICKSDGRVLCLSAAAKRLKIPERTLRHRASRGRVPGAFKEGKLWKFSISALEGSHVAEDGDNVDGGGCKTEIPWFIEFERK